MARVARYSADLITGYERSGHWTPDYPVDFWLANAQRDPDRLALVFGPQRFTWAQAADALRQLAAGLVQCGFARDDVLALQAPNSATLLLLRLAAELAGVVTVLVPPAFSRIEAQAICRRLPLAGALVAGAAAGQLADVYRGGSRAPFRLLSIDSQVVAGAVPVEDWLARPPDAESSERLLRGRQFGPYEYAAIITTSGTTGEPRLIEHAACARMAAGRVYIDRLRLDRNDVVAGATSIFSGNCDLLLYHAAPQAGAQTVLVDHFDPASFCSIVERERVTCAIFVPTLLHRLLAYGGLSKHDMSSLRIVTSFGAVLAPETSAQAERLLGVKVIQGYGAADYGALASTAIDDPPEVRLHSVGRPLPGTELRIADQDGVELPSSSRGRVYARGPYCVGGYIGDDDATADAWRGGFFAMGDVGYVDAAGYLWLAGRARELIIRGGQNIVPAEVEDMILSIPGIAEAAVLGIPDAEMGERVCAVVVPRPDVRITLDSIADVLAQRGLARFKFPERLLTVAAMPLNPAGTKINRKELRRLLLEADEDGEVASASWLGRRQM